VTFTVLNAFDWSGGTQSESGTGIAQTLLANGSNSTISGAALKTISVRRLTIDGTLVWSGTGNIALNSGQLGIQSTGVFDLQSDALLGDADGNATAAELVISGTLKKSGGAGTSALGGNLGIGGGAILATVNATGVIRAESGTLEFDGGLDNLGIVNALGNTIVLASGQGISSGTFHADAGGVVRITGGVQTLTGGAAITGAGLFDIANGRVDLQLGSSYGATRLALGGDSGALTINGALTVSQSFDWTGGTIGGSASITLAPGSVSTISGASFKTFSSGRINVGGMLAWSGTGSINGAGNGTFRVLSGGLFDLQSDASFINGSGLDTSGDCRWARCARALATAPAGSTAFPRVT
jgi:hypothetical protein